jgi:hypothetical protein
MIKLFTDRLLSDFEFLQGIGAAYGIQEKTDDSRYQAWERMQTGQNPDFAERTMWFASINRCFTQVTPEGDVIPGFFHNSYLTQYDCVCEDAYWKRDSKGRCLDNKTLKFFDRHDVLPNIFSFKENHVGVTYYLFEQVITRKGNHMVYLLRHADPARNPGIRIGDREKRVETGRWLKDLFSQPLTQDNRVLVYRKTRSYPESYLQSLQVLPN